MNCGTLNVCMYTPTASGGHALYAQDTWRIRPKLTLSYGLRWEPYLAMQNRDNQVYLFDIARFNAGKHSIVYPNAAAGLYFPGDPGYPGSAVTSNKLLNFAPRVGLAWSPSDRTRTRTRDWIASTRPN